MLSLLVRYLELLTNRRGAENKEKEKHTECLKVRGNPAPTDAFFLLKDKRW